MLLALKKILDIEKYLKDRVDDSTIKDYHLVLKVNMDIKGFIFVEKETARLTTYLNELKSNENIDFEIVTQADCEGDELYKYLFIQKEKVIPKVDLSFRRRYENLLDNINPSPKTTPIVTFYSYKGGLGRSTTLVAFAAWYAIHYEKRVVILDCDFEAPGITNYFDLTGERLANLNGGIVEYLLDRQFLGEKVDLQQYTIEISKMYSGNGEIHVMPAGNLSSEFVTPDDSNSGTHQNHYLEALSRLDLTNKERIVAQFRELLDDLQQEIKPDIILIDSRTGFNDILANIGLALSSLVVGFFGNNIQTIDGLYFFLDKINKDKLPAILVNSIISDDSFFEEFKEIVDFFIKEKIDEDIPVIDMYSIFREPRLEKLGTKSENKSTFINMIKNKSFFNYQVLFEAIDKYLTHIKETQGYSSEILQTKTHNQDDILSLKRKILKNLHKNFPELYAENIDINDSFLETRFYFRKCMEDIFNRDKFLIFGGKGTGKTLLYQAFKSKTFIQKLQERARKSGDDYEFINIISLKREKDPTKLFEVFRNFKISEIVDTDYFFTRFWLVYIWNAILIDDVLGFKSSLEVQPITNDTTTKKRFLEYINSDDKYSIIEKELKEIDDFLKKAKKNLIIAFDQLDFIVKPNLWSKGITPLIDFWRSNPYSRILPKLFVRTDLFARLGNLTNKQDLKAQSISIEWSQEELFAFFFKFVFSHSKLEFYNIMHAYKDYTSAFINEIKDVSEKDNQIPLEKKYLKPLVNTFFGEWADIDNTPRYGETYDWFYRNLQNADGTISLRPFLDLISEAINDYFKKIKPPEYEDKRVKPILNAFYFAFGKIRATAVKRHFEDLASEEGNEDLNKIFDYIRSQLPRSRKRSFFSRNEFDMLLREIITYYAHDKVDLDNQTPDNLKELLIINGVVSRNDRPGGYTSYSFALLYKYYLGLKGKI